MTCIATDGRQLKTGHVMTTGAVCLSAHFSFIWYSVSGDMYTRTDDILLLCFGLQVYNCVSPSSFGFMKLAGKTDQYSHVFLSLWNEFPINHIDPDRQSVPHSAISLFWGLHLLNNVSLFLALFAILNNIHTIA